MPVAASHVPTSWHWVLAVQVTGLPPTHEPAWQLSVLVHSLPSLHEVPSGLAGFEQVPLAELQVPAWWHWSEAVHTTGLPP